MEKRIKQLGKIFFLSTGVMASAAMLTACSQEMAALTGGSGDGAKVEVTASFVEPKQALTRAADGLDVASGFSLNTSANSSSKVRVMVDQNDGEYAQFDYDITGSAPTKTISKESGAPTFNSGVNTVNVYGWYPAKNLSGFAVATDQSTDANYCLSDLMVASGTTCTREGSTVTHAANLSFTHVMAKLKVTLNPAANVNVKAVKLKSMATTVSLTETKAGNAVTGFSGYALGSASGSSDIDLHKSTDANITSASSAADRVLCGVFPAQSKNGALLEVTANYNGGSDVVITYSFSSAKDFTDGNEYGIDITLNETALQTTAVSLDTWDPSGNATITVGGGGLALQTSSSGSNGYVTFDAIADQLYSGSALTPTPRVRVRINGTQVTLVNGTDFDFSYENNVNAGTATVKVTGKTYLSGTVSTTFNINDCQGADISTAAVGKIICSHGKVHDATTAENLPKCSGKRAAVVAYMNGGTKWAISIKNAPKDTWNNITSDGTTAGANKNTDCVVDPAKLGDLPAAPAGMTWYVLTKDNYITLWNSFGGADRYNETSNGYITAAGGTACSGDYWSTTEYNSSNAWLFSSNGWNHYYGYNNANKSGSDGVRPVLAF